MPKIILDKSKCVGCGACQAVCPRYFEIGEDNKPHLKGTEDDSEEQEVEIKEIDCAKEAAEGCPAQCIHIKE